MKMLKKIAIFALLFASLTVSAEDCRLIDNLIIRDALKACRYDIPRFELTDASLQTATDTSLVFRFVYSSRPTDTVSRFPMLGNIRGEITWLKIRDTVNNCTREHTNTIVIDTFPFPRLITRLDTTTTTLCFGDTLTLHLGKTEHTTGFSWQVIVGNTLSETRDSTREVIFDSSKIDARTLYYVAVFTGYCAVSFWDIEFGYVIRDTATVFFARPPEVDFGQDTIVCDDGYGFPLTALDARFEVSQYEFRWNESSSDVENTFRVFYESSGRQTVEVWHEICWTEREIESYWVTDTVYVDFWPHQWRTSKQPDTSVTFTCRGQNIVLDFTAITPNQTTYFWRDDTTNINPVRQFSFPGSFTIILTDSAGCKDSTTITISELFQDPEIEQHMPSVFTPNNDGYNDYFELMNNPQILQEQLRRFHLRIYNRLGREVFRFEGNPTEVRWDGTSGGSPLPEGTYFWRVNATDECGGTHREHGTVTLLR